MTFEAPEQIIIPKYGTSLVSLFMQSALQCRHDLVLVDISVKAINYFWAHPIYGGIDNLAISYSRVSNHLSSFGTGDITMPLTMKMSNGFAVFVINV